MASITGDHDDHQGPDTAAIMPTFRNDYMPENSGPRSNTATVAVPDAAVPQPAVPLADILSTPSQTTGTSLEENASPSPKKFFDLPLEIRHKIYKLCLKPGEGFPRWTPAQTNIYFDRTLSMPLMLVDHKIAADVTQNLFETVYTRIFLTNARKPMLEKVDVDIPSIHGDALSRYVLLPPPTSIRCWCLHIVWLWRDFAPAEREQILDDIVSLLAKGQDVIKSLVVAIPCLCSQDPRKKSTRYTVETWKEMVMPILERLSPLRIPGLITFVPMREEHFPPCPLRRRCQALVGHLEDLINNIEGRDSPADDESQPKRERMSGKGASAVTFADGSVPWSDFGSSRRESRTVRDYLKVRESSTDILEGGMIG